MAPASDRFKHESLEDSETIIKYLKALQEGFEKGALLFSSDERRLILKPQGLINLDFEAKRKSGEIKVTIKFRWSEPTGPSESKHPALSIQPLDKS
ncbi:MAG: amphi-Trp domain-containing protein [Thermodesulfobacteriota bacterium]